MSGGYSITIDEDGVVVWYRGTSVRGADVDAVAATIRERGPVP